MENRKEKLLKLVVENYLQTAEPVGSKFLAESENLKLSGATIRNEMRDLEEKGYLRQPHTSAGRIPTEAGYRYYINNIMKTRKIENKIENQIKSEVGSRTESRDQVLKNLAKQVSKYVNSAVILAHNHDVYYTGISNLFAHPEFHDYDQTLSVSTMFDQFEDLISGMYELIEDRDTKILIGKENPLGHTCSTVMIKVGDESLFAVLGPMRMDYGQVKGILNYISKII